MLKACIIWLSCIYFKWISEYRSTEGADEGVDTDCSAQPPLTPNVRASANEVSEHPSTDGADEGVHTDCSAQPPPTPDVRASANGVSEHPSTEGADEGVHTDCSAQPPSTSYITASTYHDIFKTLLFVLVLLLGVTCVALVANSHVSSNQPHPLETNTAARNVSSKHPHPLETNTDVRKSSNPPHPLETNTDARNESFSALQPNKNGALADSMTETCDDSWIKPNIYGLSRELNQRIIGQDLATKSILSGLEQFAHPKLSVKAKPLLLHMIGPKRLGKRTVAHLIADHLYRKGNKSQFVHVFDAEKHVNFQTTDQVISWIRGNVSACGQSMFIFENRENGTAKYGSRSILDHVLEDLFKENSERPPLIDFTKSVFVYVWNIDFDDELVQRIEELSTPGVSHDKLMRVVTDWINERVKLLSDDSILDRIIPFLPLEIHCMKQSVCYHWKA